MYQKAICPTTQLSIVDLAVQCLLLLRTECSSHGRGEGKLPPASGTTPDRLKMWRATARGTIQRIRSARAHFCCCCSLLAVVAHPHATHHSAPLRRRHHALSQHRPVAAPNPPRIPDDCPGRCLAQDGAALARSHALFAFARIHCHSRQSGAGDDLKSEMLQVLGGDSRHDRYGRYLSESGRCGQGCGRGDCLADTSCLAADWSRQ